ncbi:unnamed protein product [Merluccius merluccius]
MVNLSGTAGPISIKYGQAGAEPARLMPTQTNWEERLLRVASAVVVAVGSGQVPLRPSPATAPASPWWHTAQTYIVFAH